MRKAALHNLGCKVNAYETEAMEQELIRAGYLIVPYDEVADVYVINTCAVTNMAERKSRQMIHRAKKLNPNAIVVAAGCYVQTSEEDMASDVGVDILLGNNQKFQLVDSLKQFELMKTKQDYVIKINQDHQFEKLRISKSIEHTRAFVKVQDGCNQFCTYCIIPYARGRVRSRLIKDVLAEVEQLADNGYQEVVLTGIHLSSFGIDKGEGLLELIQAVANVQGIRRIRLGSLEPRIATKEFVEELSRIDKVCHHFHLSLQSGSNATLERMNRAYSAMEYKEGIKRLRDAFDHPGITTDVIVGFPGETEEEFKESRAFLNDIDFYEVHLFKYSRRHGTKADAMPHQIDGTVKNKRSAILQKDVAENKERFVAYYLEKDVEILLEETEKIDEKLYYVGYTKEYVKCAVLKEDLRSNTLYKGVGKAVLPNGILLIS